MPEWAWSVLGFVLAAVLGYTLAFLAATRAARERSKELQKEAADARALAEREIETLKREAVLEAKDEAIKVKQKADEDIRLERVELNRIEERLAQKEDVLERRSLSLAEKEDAIEAERRRLKDRQQDLDRALDTHQRQLEHVAQMSREEAHDKVMQYARERAEQDIARMIKDMEQRAVDESEKRAKNVIALAINRCAVDQSAESTVSVVPLPSDEMKGRIIGREGRNIRSFETLTGVDVIIDDTPEAVVLSAFDPIRREIARMALVDLVEDGRIHPARIEEAIDKARLLVDVQMQEAAETAVLDSGVVGVSNELLKHLGRLRFRTSYGQNCLRHSVEVANLAGFMASELGADVVLARRAGLFHDLGKSVDMDMEGSHAMIGQELLRKAGEPERVLHAVAAHHNDIEPDSIEAVLIQAGDAVSAARPGARRETLEAYVKRLHKLETIAESFSGVEKTFAIQAGREIRVMVRPEEISDESAALLAHETAKRIEQEMQYPGQIKVTVIRETRAVDYAK